MSTQTLNKRHDSHTADNLKGDKNNLAAFWSLTSQYPL